MKKLWKIFLLLLLLTGCGKAEPAKPRVVQQVRVTCGGITKVYTRDDKVRRVLYCLRQQETAGFSPCDPERQVGEEVRVELLLSDGACRVYRQRCGRYVSRDRHRWRRLAEEDHRLKYLLYLMEPDIVANDAVNCYNKAERR